MTAPSNGHLSPTRSLRHQGSDASLSSQAPHDAAGRSYVEWVRSWRDEQVATWLTENKCGAYEAVFRDNDIRGDVLLDVDQQALKEMGVHSVGDRIKITVAIKKLRSACVAAGVRRAPTTSSPLAPSSSTTTRGGKTIPPPLHLSSSSTSSSKLGQAYQSGSAPVLSHHAHTSSGQGSASSTSSLLSAPPASASNHLSSPGGTHVRRGSSPRHQPGPPSAPAPRSGLPPPPSTLESSPSRSRERPAASSLPPTITSTPPVQPQWQAGEYGLPRAPASQRGPTGKFPTASQSGGSSSFHGAVKAGQAAQSHRKTGSVTQGSTQPSTSPSARPSTAGPASSSYAGSHSFSSHPYATATSPTTDDFAAPKYYSSSRPGTAPSAISLAPAPTIGPSLSPITEMNSPAPSPLAAEPPARIEALARPSTSGFTVGKGGFARPSTPAGTVGVSNTGLVQSTSTPPPPLEDLMRRTVRFTGPDESGSKMVSVDGAKDAPEVLARVLKRFKLSGSEGTRQQTETERGELVTEIDGWAVFAMSADGQGARVLPDTELIAVCTSMNRPERQKGLMIRKVHHPRRGGGDFAPHARMTSASSSRLGSSPTSPGYGHVQVDPASPTPSSPESLSEHERRASYNPMNRASTVSVMSGLLDWNQPVVPLPVPSQSMGAERSSFLGGPRKLRNFFGHRPPSELISSHLADYFPSAEKKLLRRSMASRRSVAMQSGARPQSQWSNDSRMSWSEAAANVGSMPSRFSMSSVGSVDSGLLAAPPVPAKDHYAPTALNDDKESNRRASALLLSPTTEETQSSAMSSRLSVYSTTTTASKRDSDNASLLTVDEITAAVEHRRASWAEDDGSETDESEIDAITRPKSIRRRPSTLPSSEDEEEDEETEESEVESEDEVAVDEAPEKVTSSGGALISLAFDADVGLTSRTDKSQIKWIKGAVIGTGSFGVVSLGALRLLRRMTSSS